MEYKHKRRLCWIGVTMMIVGRASFSNHPMMGDIVTLFGAGLIIFKEVAWRWSRTK